MSELHVQGKQVVNSKGEVVLLRGAGLGGWMLMENFISGFPGCEFQIREKLDEVIGSEKAEFFFDKYLEYFFTEQDARYIASLGLNCLRVAFSYRHFEDDMNPRKFITKNLHHLTNMISLCARHQIYVILDLHALPGGQSGGWHCNSGTHLQSFFKHKDFQDRVVWLWKELTKIFSNPKTEKEKEDWKWVAGYNLINEPADPSGGKVLVNVYDRTIEGIREVEKEFGIDEGKGKIVFLDGNSFATDFTNFPEDPLARWGSNIVFSIHDYSTYGFPNPPGGDEYEGRDDQKEKILQSYLRKRKWMDERPGGGLCVWNGEWGPVYARKQYDGEEWEDINKRRMKVLKEQLGIYDNDQLSWSIWLYKDIGFQGMVYVSPSSKYINHFNSFLKRKHRLAVDAWGKDDTHVKHIYKPISDLIRSAVSENPAKLKLYPPHWSVEERTTRIARTMLVAEFMVGEWADMFVGLDYNELDELARSFHWDNCLQREELNEVLREHASLSPSRV